MTKDDVLTEFREAGALLEGHFILSSGKHSPVFFQKAFVFTEPERTERLCRALAGLIEAAFGRIDIVVSPAVGAIIPGYETARALKARAMFVEREAGAFQLRRGFVIPDGARVVLVEDVITTGLSVREAVAALAASEGVLCGVACLIDRSGGKADVGLPLVSLATVEAPAYDAHELPAALAALPAIKPGSRGLAG